MGKIKFQSIKVNQFFMFKGLPYFKIDELKDHPCDCGKSFNAHNFDAVVHFCDDVIVDKPFESFEVKYK